MFEELNRLGRALEDLLALGRLDAGAPEGRTVPVRVGALVHQALHLSDHPEYLLVQETLGAEELLVLVDQAQVVRALANLVRNADLHGGGLTNVRLAAVGAMVDIHVEDAGPGVPEADRERIFERFARAGRHRSGTGSGLGLSIVRQTVLNHGGTVWCTTRHVNDDSTGADFVLRLPVVTPERDLS